MLTKWKAYAPTSHNYRKTLVAPDGTRFPLGVDTDNEAILALIEYLNKEKA